MRLPVKRIAIILGVALAVVPLLLFATMALYNRLYIDDYLYFGMARDIGIWKLLLVWREFWNGGYTNFLLYGLLAPLGATASALSSLFVAAIAFAGFGWLINSLLDYLAIQAHRRAIVVALAAISAAAAINGLYHAQVFYWLTGAVVYHWPAALLLLGIAAAAAMGRRLQSRRQLILAAMAVAVCAFINGGFSEMVVGFQLSALALITGFVFIRQNGPRRRAWRILAPAACLGTVLSLLLQVSSPGFATRSAQTAYFGLAIFPARELPDLIERTLDGALYYIGQPDSFGSFMLIVFAGLFLSMSAGARPRLDEKPQPIFRARAPLALALLPQLIFIPILWSHQSDSLQVFSRFSYAFALVAAVNLLAIACLLALLWKRDRFDQLVNRRNGLMAYCAGVLLVVCLVFALTQVRNIHYKAASYLFVTTVSALLLLAGQLAAHTNEPRLRALFRIGAFASAGALLILAALLAVQLWSVGLIFERALTPVIYTLMLAALLIGLTLGAVIRQAARVTDANAVWLRWMRLGSLLAALTIAAGIVIGQGQRLEFARRNAEIWDATHAEIIRLRDAGDPDLYTKRFPRLKVDRLDTIPFTYKRETILWAQMIYYGLEDGFEAIPQCQCQDTDYFGHDEVAYCAAVLCLAYERSGQD